MAATLNFLLSAESDLELSWLSKRDPRADWRNYLTGERCWALKTYQVLKQRTKVVTLSRTYNRSAINFAHPQFINRVPPDNDVFLVSLQADYPFCRLANRHIVQNQCQTNGSNRIWLPHWPMDGLLRRNGQRSEVANVGYMGNPIFLAGKRSDWTSLAASLGMNFVTMSESCCNDFSDIDIVVGVRSFDRKGWPMRPAWKLMNAWHAGVPFIGGWDSAYGQVGEPGRDYLRVESRQELVDALQMLRSDPKRYSELVEAGTRRAAEYTTESIGELWLKMVESELEPAFRHWCDGGGWRRRQLKRIVWNIERGVRTRVAAVMKKRKWVRGRPGRWT